MLPFDLNFIPSYLPNEYVLSGDNFTTVFITTLPTEKTTQKLHQQKIKLNTVLMKQMNHDDMDQLDLFCNMLENKTLVIKNTFTSL